MHLNRLSTIHQIQHSSTTTMKVAVLILGLVALVASMAYAAPQDNENAEIESLVEKLMEQERAMEQGYDDDDDDDDCDDDEAALQELLGELQANAKTQWFRKAAKVGGKLLKKHGPRLIRFGLKHGSKFLG